MLTLRRNYYEFDVSIPNEYRVIDRQYLGATTLYGTDFGRLSRVYRKDMSCAFAPLVYNDIKMLSKSYGITDPSEMIDNYLEDIEGVYNELPNDTFAFIRIYAENVDQVYNRLDTDLYTTPANAVQELYNKCMSQVQARQGLQHDIYTKVKISRTKHLIILVSNYSDNDQASDSFLTLGLIPVLFPDWKDKFNEEEIEYFKVLVNRSQVKRISNTRATEAYNIAINTEKYTNKLRELQLRNTIERLVDNRIRTARQTVESAEARADEYLRGYQDQRRKYYDSQVILNNLEKTRTDTMEEINAAIQIEGIKTVAVGNNDSLYITFVAPATFFNTDEAELVINNMPDNWVKQFFTDVFLEQKYKLHLYSKFMFSYEAGRNFNPPGSESADILQSFNAMYNPHLYFFNCLGDYRPQLADAQAHQDLLIFNNLALASTKSINFRDGTVMNRWRNSLYEYSQDNGYTASCLLNSKCLEDEDGNRLSIREVYLNPVTEAGELEVEDL